MTILKYTDCSKDVLQICKIYCLQFLLIWKPTQVDLDSLDKTGMFFPAIGTWSLWAAIRQSISAMASLDRWIS